jgi:hypothetical protein
MVPSVFQLSEPFEPFPNNAIEQYQLVASKFDVKRLNAGNIASTSKTSSTYASVANTTTVRRESHGHLLAPIKAKLDHLGLLSSRSSSASLGGLTAVDKSSDSSSMEVEIGSTPSAYSNTTQTSSEPAASSNFLPPHIRSRQATSSSVDTLRPSQMANENDKPQHPSLRATAQEFTPKHVLQDELTQLVQHGALDYRPDEAWSSLSPRVRQSIVELRQFRKHLAHGDQAGRFNRERNAADLTVVQSPAQPVASKMTDASSLPLHGVAADSPTLSYDHGKWLAHAVDGKAFVPSFGRAPPPVWPQLVANPVSLALSPGPAHAAPSSPFIASSSLNVSPSSTLMSNSSPGSAWSFESPNNNGPADGMWAGSDGREIAFVGDGIRAERQRRANGPFRPRRYQDQYSHGGGCSPRNGHWQAVTSPRKQVRDASAPRLVGMDHDDQVSAAPRWYQGSSSPASPPLAPRSRQQWLEMSRRAKPCVDHVEIVAAAEALPFLLSLDKNVLRRGERESFRFCGSCVTAGGAR